MPKVSLTCSRFANIIKAMRVISKARLVEFWRIHANSKSPLTNWYNHVGSKNTTWTSFACVRKDYSSVDKVGECYVFDIGGNNFRLVVKIIRECVYIRKLMTHAEYNEQKWVVECKCLEDLKIGKPETEREANKTSAKKVRRK